MKSVNEFGTILTLLFSAVSLAHADTLAEIRSNQPQSYSLKYTEQLSDRNPKAGSFDARSNSGALEREYIFSRASGYGFVKYPDKLASNNKLRQFGNR